MRQDKKPALGCTLTEDGLVLIQINDGENVVAITMPAKEAREAFSQMFVVAAAGKDYATS